MYQFVEIFDSRIFGCHIKFHSTSYRFYIISIYRTFTRTMFTVVMRLQCADDSLIWICKSVQQPKSRDDSIFWLGCECATTEYALAHKLPVQTINRTSLHRPLKIRGLLSSLLRWN